MKIIQFQYDEFMNKFDEYFLLSDFLKKIIPGIQFEEEIGSDGRHHYLKTKCIFIESTSQLPTLYIGKELAPFYHCFDCGHGGGPIKLLRDYFNINDDTLSFEIIRKEIGSNISDKETIEKIIQELEDRGAYEMDTYFESSFLGDKYLDEDGVTWKSYYD